MAIEYPKMLFHEDGRTLTVLDAEQEAAAGGFGPDPHDIHRNPINPAAVARVDASGQDDLIEKIAERVVERLSEFLGGTDDQPSDRPRRGRPPNVTRQRAGTFTPSNGDNGNG